MGSTCSTCSTCYPCNQPTPVVHPSSHDQGNYPTPRKTGSAIHLKKDKLSSPRNSPANSRGNSPTKGIRNGSPSNFQQESTKKERHHFYQSKSLGGDSSPPTGDDNYQNKYSNKGSRKKIRQEERQVEVTTVQTIKETRIIHIEREGSGENSRVDSLPTTTDNEPALPNQQNIPNPTPPQQTTSADPAKPAYKITNPPPGTISREYFPLKSNKQIPEDLLRSNDSKNTNKQGTTSTFGTEVTENSILYKHQSMETPYTRDCESPAPRYLRHASVAASVVDSTVTEVDPTVPTAMKCAAQKLRMLLEAFSDGTQIEKATIIESLTYAVNVLDHNYQMKKKSALVLSFDQKGQALDMEESESFAESLSRATSVDNLVRNWLVHTFTRSTSRAGVYGLDDKNINKKNFKSVANVIRISIMVDRFRRSLYRISIPDYLKPYFKRFCYWDFDVFELHRVSGGHSLRFVCFEALSRFGVCTRFKIRRTVMEKLLNKLEEGYCLHHNPYHNVVHGADVTQVRLLLPFIAFPKFMKEWLSELEIFTVIIAAAIHDYEHTGTTNNFHINTKSDLALFYNDRSVLENYHVSAAFRLMAQDPELNIFTGLSSQEYKEMRALLIEVVLNTDMQFHFAQVKNMRTTLSLLDADQSPAVVSIDKSKVLSLIVHSADVSHPGRCWPLHLKWSKMLCQEFFNQGDREKALEMTVSPLCDRLTTNVASSQIGFIDFIVAPTFDVVVDMVERILNPLFLQHKARSSATLLPTVDEGEENPPPGNPAPVHFGHMTENEPLAGQEEYAAMAGESGEPCEFIPFKWDARQATLKLYRFYAKNIENNKVQWRKHIEDEVNDPMYFKRFERDPVVELGWVWADDKKEEEAADDKKKPGETEPLQENELKNKLRKEESSASEEERKKKKKLRAEEGDSGEGKEKHSKNKEKHHHKHHHHHHHRKRKESQDMQNDQAVSGEQQEPPAQSDQESVVGDFLAGELQHQANDEDLDDRLSDVGNGELIGFDERDLALGDDHDERMTVKTDDH